MSLDLNIDFYHHHQQQQPSTESDTSSSSIVDDEDHSTSIKKNRPLSTTLFFDILNRDSHHQTQQPPDPCGSEGPLTTMPLFPSPVLSSSPAGVVPQWLNLSFADSRKQQPAEPYWRLQNQQQHQLLLMQQKPAAKKSRRGPRSRSSPYRGVTFYRRTGRWESHIWDCGKQVYLGGFDSAHAAARAYDRAAIKFRGVEADINFDLKDYDQDRKLMVELSKEEFVQLLRRQSTGFTRTSSKYRGVTWHKYGLGQVQGLSFPSWTFEREAAFARYNEEKAVANIGTSTYGRGNLNVDPVDKGSDRTLDLSLGVTSSFPRMQLDEERHMFDRSAAPVLCGQPPPHDFKKPSPLAWQFTQPSGSGYLSHNKKGTSERRSMAQTNPLPRFQDQTAMQVPLMGSAMAPMQLLSAAASSGFPTGIVPAAPTHMWAPPCNGFSYNYRGY